MEFYRTSGADSQPSRVEVSSTCTGVGGRPSLIDDEFREQERFSDSARRKTCDALRSPSISNRAVKRSVLLPTKYLRRERGANYEHQDQRRYVARVRQPRVALPNSLKQRHGVG
jgi:hypothetical protein